jgi:glutathione-regulated potassium-efflux system ancillary protein KefC
MTEIFILAAFWLSLAVVSSILANHLRTSTALMEICVGIAAAAAATRFIGPDALGADGEWLRFLAVLGAVILTFLAGAELEPAAIRTKWKEVTVVGLVGFLAPFLGCTAVAYYLLGWDPRASLLAGVVLSETSVAIVYSVMLETGLNRTGFGKGILGACFITDLGTVLALGLIFAPFTYKTLVFLAVSTATIAALPFLTRSLTRRYAYRTAAIRTKWVLLVLFGLGGLALWSGSEAVLPAYLAGMVLAGAAAQDPFWVRRLRTLTIGLLTPFYFLRAGSLVSLPALLTAPLIFLLLLGGKVASKVIGLYPVVGLFREERSERWYYKLMMSTGLTFGTIAALYGFSHGIVTHGQYSFLVAAVIGSAVISTTIANFAFLPRHLLPSRSVEASGSGTGGTAPIAAENGPDGLQDE